MFQVRYPITIWLNTMASGTRILTHQFLKEHLQETILSFLIYEDIRATYVVDRSVFRTLCVAHHMHASVATVISAQQSLFLQFLTSSLLSSQYWEKQLSVFDLQCKMPGIELCVHIHFRFFFFSHSRTACRSPCSWFCTYIWTVFKISFTFGTFSLTTFRFVFSLHQPFTNLYVTYFVH